MFADRPKARRPGLPALLLVLLAAMAQPAAAATRFVAGLEDVPLMDGLVEVPDSQTRFDTPSGRLFEIDAAGPVSADRLSAFYRTSLAALGWQQTGAGLTFRRDAEQLTITPRRVDAGTAVHFSLKPAPP